MMLKERREEIGETGKGERFKDKMGQITVKLWKEECEKG